MFSYLVFITDNFGHRDLFYFKLASCMINHFDRHELNAIAVPLIIYELVQLLDDVIQLATTATLSNVFVFFTQFKW